MQDLFAVCILLYTVVRLGHVFHVVDWERMSIPPQNTVYIVHKGFGFDLQMVHPNSCQNLLTSLSTDQWRTVRKALAVSFSQGSMKKQYRVVLEKVNELLSRLELMDLSGSVNMDQAALKVTLDVIGLVSS